MKLYSIQVGYKGTDGRLTISEQDFEGETSEQALTMAKAFYSNKIVYRNTSEMIFSTPIEVSKTKSRSVSIGGSASGATIVTGNGNNVVKHQFWETL